MATIIITSEYSDLIRHFGDELLAEVCCGKTLECEITEDGNADVLYRGELKFWLDKSLFTVKEEAKPKVEKYPTVYRGGGGGSRWIATFQCLTVEEAQEYIDQFDDERSVRWAKYNPERTVFTNGKGYREYGVRSSKQLRFLKFKEALGK